MATDSDRQKVQDIQIIDIIRNHEDPFVTAKEIANRLPITRQQVNSRLGQLEGQEILECKECGSGKGWWVTR